MSTIKLSITNNPGAVFYAGEGYSKPMSMNDTSLDHYTIRIIITNEELENVKVGLIKGSSILKEIEVPSYKMVVTDNKTNNEVVYQVTRDTLFFDRLNSVQKRGGVSYLGISLFQKKVISLPTVLFEPKKYSIEKYEVSNLRKMTQNFVSYKMEKVGQIAYLIGGNIPVELVQSIEKEDSVNFFYVVEGKKFRDDIKERESILGLTPEVEILLMKRDNPPTKIETTKSGELQRIVYL